MAVEAGLRHEVQNDLAVHGGLKNGATGFEFLAESGRVGQIAVVSNGDLPARAINGEGLSISQMGRAGGGIAGVADGNMAWQFLKHVARKNLRNQSHSSV